MAIDKAACTILSRVSGTEVVDFDEEKDYSDDINLNNNYIPDGIELLLGDVPEDNTPNTDNIWAGTLFLDGGKGDDTFTWTADGRTGTLKELMQNNFIDLFQHPQQVLSVRVYTKLIDSCTVLQEINNTTTYNKYFMIKRASWEAQEGYWDIEAHQLAFAFAEREDYITSEGDVGEEAIISEGDVGESNIERE